MSSAQNDAARALAELERWGVLLLQDAKLPSLAILIAGGPIRGSWWGHPEGQRIFRAAGVLDDHEDVATFKLVDAKVSFVHRRLWPHIVAIGSAREPWQMEGLGDEAKETLARVDREGRVRATKKPAKQLELRLLAASQDVHTESGAHATDLVRWDRFAEERSIPTDLSMTEAKRELERVVRELGDAHGASPRLPWEKKRRRG